jgi:hypothetical protein
VVAVPDGAAPGVSRQPRLDRRCLTESAGAHPLFAGVRRATISGMPDEPLLEESEGVVKLSAPGLTVSFRHARVVRGGKTPTVLVEKPG